jgi:hypothetical protein
MDKTEFICYPYFQGALIKGIKFSEKNKKSNKKKSFLFKKIILIFGILVFEDKKKEIFFLHQNFQKIFYPYFQVIATLLSLFSRPLKTWITVA